MEPRYARWAADDHGDEQSWGHVTAEPGGVDYLEVSADGVPAMWLRPHGAADDRVIVALHGGGFVGGSLWTHRKVYGHLAKATGVRVLHADLSGLPPTYGQVGVAESGLGDAERLVALAGKAGVETRLDVFAGQLHTFQMTAGNSPAADDAIRRFAGWARLKLAI